MRKVFLLFIIIFSLGALASQNYVNLKDQKIAIIGAGPSGLMAAYQLKENGYKNVTVFEKESSVGGKVKTLNIDGFKIELGAILTMNNYKEVHKLAKKYNIPIEVFNSELMVYSKNQKSFIPYKGFTGSNLFQSTLAAMNFLKTKVMKKEFSQAGLGDVKNEDMYLPMREFANVNGFKNVFLPFEYALVACGYGYMDEVPAIYPLKLLNIMYSVGLKGVIKSKLPILKNNLLLNNLTRVNVGFQNLWKKVASELNVKLNTPVTNIERSKINGHQKINIITKDGHELFDKVIISTNPYNTSKYLDLTSEEDDIFKKVHSYNYHVTVFRSKELKRKQTVFFEENKTRDRIGHVIVYMNYYEDSDVFVAYQQADWGTKKETLKELLKDDLSELGANIKDEDIVLQKNWSYFPHFKEQDLRDGVAQRLEDLQGQNATFYTGATLSFETTESVSRYSKELINKFFPKGPVQKVISLPLNSL